MGFSHPGHGLSLPCSTPSTGIKPPTVSPREWRMWWRDYRTCTGSSTFEAWASISPSPATLPFCVTTFTLPASLIRLHTTTFIPEVQGNWIMAAHIGRNYWCHPHPLYHLRMQTFWHWQVYLVLINSSHPRHGNKGQIESSNHLVRYQSCRAL